MKTAICAGLLALGLTLPAMADPVTDANFVVGVNTCINFGSDSWFVQDRIEGAGWTSRHDMDYDTTVFDSPDGSVVLIPPPEGGAFPVWCSVISQDVTLGFAEDTVRSVLVNSGINAIRGTEGGCRAFRTGNDVTIRVLNDGNEEMCDQRMSARINVVTFSDPVAGQ